MSLKCEYGVWQYSCTTTSLCWQGEVLCSIRFSNNCKCTSAHQGVVFCFSTILFCAYRHVGSRFCSHFSPTLYLWLWYDVFKYIMNKDIDFKHCSVKEAPRRHQAMFIVQRLREIRSIIMPFLLAERWSFLRKVFVCSTAWTWQRWSLWPRALPFIKKWHSHFELITYHVVQGF